MNYLAHFHLTYGDNDLMVGGLLGDFIKGPLRGEHRQGLEHGILLHRKIDRFTDSHALLAACHRQFDARYRRFAGIMTDVVFDHFLSTHWDQFHPQSLAQFSTELFGILAKSTELTTAARAQAETLARYDVFHNYREWETVNAALSRIGQRLRRDNPLAAAAAEMEQHYALLEDTFMTFYPLLQEHVAQQRELLQTNV